MASGSESREYKLIPEISKNDTGWTAKVIVAAKTNPRVATKSPTKSPTKHQSVILIDPEGNKIRATLYDATINALHTKLQVTKTYLISNATVKEARPEFRERSNELQWTITSRTLVQELNETHDNLLETSYNFTPFSQLQVHMDKISDINILAVVVDIRPKKTVQLQKSGETSTIQELILLNQQCQTLTLTMWDAFVDVECLTISNIIHRKPIIAGLQLRVVSHNGSINVQTKPTSCFVVDPQLKSAKLLQNWMLENASKINTIIVNQKYDAIAIPLCRPPPEQLTPIKDIEDMTFLRTHFWAEGIVSLDNFTQSFWYPACNRCHRATGSQIHTFFECLFCNTSQAKVVPRPRIDVKIHDSTGSILATVFGETAETLFSHDANEFMNLTSKALDQTLIQEFFKLSDGEKRVLYLKASKNVGSYSDITKFTLLFAFKHSTSDDQQLEPNTSSDESQLQGQPLEAEIVVPMDPKVKQISCNQPVPSADSKVNQIALNETMPPTTATEAMENENAKKQKTHHITMTDK